MSAETPHLIDRLQVMRTLMTEAENSVAGTAGPPGVQLDALFHRVAAQGKAIDALTFVVIELLREQVSHVRSASIPGGHA